VTTLDEGVEATASVDVAGDMPVRLTQCVQRTPPMFRDTQACAAFPPSVLVLDGVPAAPHSRVASAAMLLAAGGRPDPGAGSTAHVLVVLALALPAVARAVAATGVALADVETAAAYERDYRFDPPGLPWGVRAFLDAALAEPDCDLGRLARAYGWTRRDTAAIADAAAAPLPLTLPGLRRG
jgi:hypothetical protein